MKTIYDPSLDHLDKKIFAWLLCAVLIGLIAGLGYSSYEEKTWRSARHRTTGARPHLRTNRKRTALLTH